MQGRKQILDIFSTFLMIAGDRTSWHAAGPLQRNMQIQLKEQSLATKHDWSVFWYARWQDKDPLALDHLRSYLQESCYWAARKSAGGFVHGSLELEDCFQIAIQAVDRVLAGYDPEQGFSLENYAGPIFRSVINKSLRRDHQVDICTSWSLLRRFSRKRLREALLQEGCTVVELESRLLAWRCYRQLYTPTSHGTVRTLPRPDGETWTAIARLYERERERERHLAAGGSEIESWMLSAAQALRNYQNPTIMSVNQPRAGADQGEFLDLLMADGDTPLERLLLSEEEQRRTQLRHQVGVVLAEALLRLTPEVQELLELYYRHDLTQQQLAERLQTQQYTISRRLSRAKDQLLRSIALWAKNDLHVSINPNVLEVMCQHLENWLNEYFNRCL